MTILAPRYVDLPPPIARAAETREDHVVNFWLNRRIPHSSEQSIDWRLVTYDSNAKLRVSIHESSLHIIL